MERESRITKPKSAKAKITSSTMLDFLGKPSSNLNALRMGLAAETAKPSKSLHRMLSKKGNPSMDNLAAIFDVVRKRLGVNLQAQAVEAA